MPRYDFHCDTCTLEFSEVLPIGTKDLPACPRCAETKAVRKIIRPPMVHFKGTGFYRTDSSRGMKQKKEEAKESLPDRQAGKETTKPAETKTTEAKPSEKKSEPKK